MDALRHQDHASEPGGRKLPGRSVFWRFCAPAGADCFRLGVCGLVCRRYPHVPGGPASGAVLRAHFRRFPCLPSGGRICADHGQTQRAFYRLPGGYRQSRGGLPGGAPCGLCVHAGGGRIHPVFRRWEKLGQCDCPGRSERPQGRHGRDRPARTRRRGHGHHWCNGRADRQNLRCGC